MARCKWCSGVISAMVLVAVPVMALSLLGLGISEAGDLPAVTVQSATAEVPSGDALDRAVEMDPVVLLNRWEYTSHDCGFGKSQGRRPPGKGKSPMACPPQSPQGS